MVLGGRSQLLEISLAVGLGCKPTEDGLFPVSLDQLAARRPSQNSNLLLSGYKESQPFCIKQIGLHTACVPARSRLFTRLQERRGTRQLGERQLVLPMVSTPHPCRTRPAVTCGASTGLKNGTKTAPHSAYTVLYPFGFFMALNSFLSKACTGAE